MIQIRIRAERITHIISPGIYGASYAQSGGAGIKCTVDRWGGNNASRYNPQQNADNKGSDWYFQSIPMGGDTPGGYTRDFAATAAAAGADAMLTVPMLGWVAKLGSGRAKTWSYSIAKYGAQQSNDWQWCPDAGNGARTNGQIITGNDPNDANIPTSPASFATWIASTTTDRPNVKYWLLDNEPGLWAFTHRDVVPTAPTSQELFNRSLQTAKVIRANAPNAAICGPEEWGWSSYFYSPRDFQIGQTLGWGSPMPDRTRYGGRDPLTVYLQQFRSHHVTTGRRMLDYLTLHYYPQGGEFSDDTSPAMCLRRNRSTRALWDLGYRDESWINDTVRLIPRMKDLVRRNYPGTKTGITEYCWGADGHINGATTQADILGIFGREALDLGCRWVAPAEGSITWKAMQLFRNAGDSGLGFGDGSVAASIPNPDDLSAFSAIDRKTGHLTIMVINKTAGEKQVRFVVSGFRPGTVRRWTLRADNTVQDESLGQMPGLMQSPGTSVQLYRIAPRY